MDEWSLVTTNWLLSCFSGKQKLARERYRAFVQAGNNQPSPWESLNNQIYPGRDSLIEERQCKLDPEQSLKDIPRKKMQTAAMKWGSILL